MTIYRYEPQVEIPSRSGVEAEGPTADGRVALRIHSSMTKSMLFLCQALKASRHLSVLSVTPGTRGYVEMLLALDTRDVALEFIRQLSVALDAAHYELDQAPAAA